SHVLFLPVCFLASLSRGLFPGLLAVSFFTVGLFPVSPSGFMPSGFRVLRPLKILSGFQGRTAVYLSRSFLSPSATAITEYHTRLPLSTTFLIFLCLKFHKQRNGERGI
ncbi:MAG: hypothetical protein NC345_00260, partial [Lachnospira sp.]|nr:hypothetical protein [Lachnospira sp.]